MLKYRSANFIANKMFEIHGTLGVSHVRIEDYVNWYYPDEDEVNEYDYDQIYWAYQEICKSNTKSYSFYDKSDSFYGSYDNDDSSYSSYDNDDSSYSSYNSADSSYSYPRRYHVDPKVSEDRRKNDIRRARNYLISVVVLAILTFICLPDICQNSSLFFFAIIFWFIGALYIVAIIG